MGLLYNLEQLKLSKLTNIIKELISLNHEQTGQHTIQGSRKQLNDVSPHFSPRTGCINVIRKLAPCLEYNYTVCKPRVYQSWRMSDDYNIFLYFLFFRWVWKFYSSDPGGRLLNVELRIVEVSVHPSCYPA